MNSKKLSHLIEEAQKGAVVAYAQLYSECVKPIYYLALKMTISQDDAMDIAEETMVRFFRSLPVAADKAELTTFLNRIAYNCSLDRLRQNKALTLTREVSRAGEFLCDEEVVLIPESYVSNPSRRAEIIRMVEMMGATQKAILVMYYHQGVEIKEIGDILGMEGAAAWDRLLRARAALQCQLDCFGLQGETPGDNPAPALSRIMQLDAKDTFHSRTSSIMWRNVGAKLGLPSAEMASALPEAIRSAAGDAKDNDEGTVAFIFKKMFKSVSSVAAASIVLVGCLGLTMFYTATGNQWDQIVVIADQQTPMAAYLPGEFIAANTYVENDEESDCGDSQNESRIPVTQPSITADKTELSYPHGLVITPQRIAEDAGIVAISQAGDQLPLVVEGLDEIDFSVTGSYQIIAYPSCEPLMEISITLHID